MKKQILVSLVVVLVFIGYSSEIRQERPKLSAPSIQTTSTSKNGNTNKNTQNGQSGNQSPTSTIQYKDGTYIGSVENAFYGDVQVKAIISGGKITAVDFIKSPDTHGTSVFINNQAMPYLEQEAIQSQTAAVDVISGATYTSEAFIQSLTNALSQAS